MCSDTHIIAMHGKRFLNNIQAYCNCTMDLCIQVQGPSSRTKVGYLNPLSPNVADLQHFDIELFCGFCRYNTFCSSAEFFTVSLLILPLSQALVIKAG